MLRRAPLAFGFCLAGPCKSQYGAAGSWFSPFPSLWGQQVRTCFLCRPSLQTLHGVSLMERWLRGSVHPNIAVDLCPACVSGVPETPKSFGAIVF